MHLNIKNHEAHRIATELSRLRGETLTTVVTAALRDSLDRERRRLGRTGIAESLMAIGQAYMRLPDGEQTNSDAVIGYDENGLPT